MIQMLDFLSITMVVSACVFGALSALSFAFHGFYWSAGEDPDRSENVYQAAMMFALIAVALLMMSVATLVVSGYLSYRAV